MVKNLERALAKGRMEGIKPDIQIGIIREFALQDIEIDANAFALYILNSLF